MLGGTSRPPQASQQPNGRCRAQYNQRPCKSGDSDHRAIVPKPAKGTVRLEKPRLYQIAGADGDERWKIVHVSNGQRGYDADEDEERQDKVPEGKPP